MEFGVVSGMDRSAGISSVVSWIRTDHAAFMRVGTPSVTADCTPWIWPGFPADNNDPLLPIFGLTD